MLQSSKSARSPVLVGRATTLNTLEDITNQARSRRGQVAVIAGQPGIGKSRVVKELTAHLTGSGFLALQGNCYEMDRSLPYGPLVDLLRGLASRVPDEIRTALAPFATDLVKLLPELASKFPDTAPSPPLQPEQEKHRLFQSLHDLFSRLSADQPILLVIEDLHWSDETSLEFLLYLARRISDKAILLALTYRNDEPEVSLLRFLAELDRGRLSTEVLLQPLSIPEVELMLNSIFDLHRPVRSEFLEMLFRLTEGNPFFIEEVLKELLEAGEIFYSDGSWDRKPLDELHVPRSVRDAVQRRSEGLAKSSREALLLAAIIGRRFDFDLPQALTGMDEAALLEVIRQFVAAQLVVEESADRFAFRHALTREAIYSSLLLRERRRYHNLIADTIERIYSGALEEHIPELAFHFFEARSWEKALEYSRRAGEKARSLYAPREAIAHFSRALESARHIDRPAPVEVMRGRGLAYETIGEFEAARLDQEKSLAAAEQTHDGLGEWQSLIDLGSLWASKDYAKTGEYFHRALEQARSLQDPFILARSLNRLGNWLVNTGAAAEGLQAHREALGIFSERNDKQGMADTLDLLGMAEAIAADMPSAVAAYGRAVELFRELGDSRGLVSALIMSGSLGELNETSYRVECTAERLEREAAEALVLARQIGWTAGEVFVHFTSATSLAMFGQFGAALEHGLAAVRLATEIEHRQWICGANTHLAGSYFLMLMAKEAIAVLVTVRPLAFELGSSWWIGNNTAYLALAHLLRHDTGQGRAVLEQAAPLDRVPRDTPERRMRWAWGELALAEGDAQTAMDISEQLLASVPGPRSSEPIPVLLKLKGEALLALDRPDEARRALESAREGALLRGATPLLWQIHCDLAKVYGKLHRQEDALLEASAARATIQSLAATVEEPLRSRFINAALGKVPKEKTVSPRRVAKREYDGLTEREREVAALVARGHSNPEIAAALVISERTVTTHVSNILSKLGFASRSQIAAWAVQKGLVEPGSDRLE